jgi:hypothetical protein
VNFTRDRVLASSALIAIAAWAYLVWEWWRA